MLAKSLVLLMLLAGTGWAAEAGFDGRWAITVENHPLGRVFWLEVRGAGSRRVEGWFIGGSGGGIDPLLEAMIDNGELSFAVERWIRRDGQRQFARTVTRARLAGELLQGVTQREGRELRWTGRRAREIADTDDGSWRAATPVVLFDGKDLSQWHLHQPGREGDWFVQDGYMRNRQHATLAVSNDKFWNFKLHAEYRLGERSNSGIALRGRYEVQILEDDGRAPQENSHGAIYSRIAPSVNASKPANQWQTLDATLIGRQVTVVLNGTTIVDKQPIEGFTAMASDANYGEPGPITIQGDHGIIEFRKIVVTPLVR